MKTQILSAAILVLPMTANVLAQEDLPCTDRPKMFRDLMSSGRVDEAHRLCVTADVFKSCREFQIVCARDLRDHHEREKNFKLARDMGARVLKREDATLGDHFAMGRILIELEAWSEALTEFEMAEGDLKLWHDARYNRLIIMESVKAGTEASRRDLWEELVKRYPKDAQFKLGFFFHLYRTDKLKDAYRLLKTLNPTPKRLGRTEAFLMDKFFDDSFPFIDENARPAFFRLWGEWLTNGRLRALRSAEVQLANGKCGRAKGEAERLGEEFQDGPYAGFVPRALLLQGICLSRARHHSEAARIFDKCAVGGETLCRGWLARELAYLGRWDLAHVFWLGRLKDGSLTSAERGRVQKLVAQATDAGADKLLRRDLGYPAWMKSRFP